MRLLPAELMAAFASAETGSRLWLPGLGRSMAPLLRSGDSLLIERCGEGAVTPGDIVLCRDGAGVWAHVVETSRPLRTTSFLGVVDERPGELLGRAVAIRRGGLVIQLTTQRRVLLHAAVRLLRSLRSSPLARRTVRNARAVAYGATAAPLRQLLLGEVRLRPLGRPDLTQTLRFCGDYLAIDAAFVKRQLESRWSSSPHAFGAFDRHDRMVGFSFVDEYAQEGVPLQGEWIRFHFVAPVARRLGVAERLAAALIEASRSRGRRSVFADVRSDNEAGLRLFSGLGFQLDAALSQQVNRARRVDQGTYVALVKPLDH